MKKLKRVGSVIAVLLLLVLTACGTEPLGDTYVEGSDYQYQLNTEDNFRQIKARGENGYFFLREHYLYYFDDVTQQLSPLCNKVDCLHDMEIEEAQYEKCNAYVKAANGNNEEVGISYCNGYLYLLDVQPSSNQLYRIKEDGSQKEMLQEWETQKGAISQWCIHRDVFYFVYQEFTVNDEGTWKSEENYSIKKMPLTGTNAYKETVIYEVNKDFDVAFLGNLKAYGNHIYFEELGNTVKDISVITDENYLEYQYHDCITYNTETEELKKIKIPQEENFYLLQNITFWQDKLILNPTNMEVNEGEGNQKIYIAELDGSNPEVLLEDTRKGERCFSDGVYLYLSNASLVLRGLEETQFYKVYDKTLNVIDTFQMAYEGGGDVEIGYPEKLYFFLPNEEKTGANMYCFDKSTIGTYQGNAFETELVATYFYSKEISEEIEEGE